MCGHNPNFVDFVASNKVISGGQNRLPKVLGCHRSILVSVAIITHRYTTNRVKLPKHMELFNRGALKHLDPLRVGIA